MSNSLYEFVNQDGALILLVAFPMVLLFIWALCQPRKGWEGEEVHKHVLAGSAVPRYQLPLTQSEKRTFVQVARGNSHKIAADILGLQRRTVSNQINVVYLKKGVNNIASAVARCLRDGDITLDDILPPEDQNQNEKSHS